MMTINRKLHVQRGPKKRNRVTKKTPAVREVGPGHVQRISKLMALAIRFEGLLRDSVVTDQSELAELAQVSQPRMTQIMNLLHLSPDIQEQLLFLPEVTGKDVVTEKNAEASYEGGGVGEAKGTMEVISFSRFEAFR